MTFQCRNCNAVVFPQKFNDGHFASTISKRSSHFNVWGKIQFRGEFYVADEVKQKGDT
jgi:hypothetical protein